MNVHRIDTGARRPRKDGGFYATARWRTFRKWILDRRRRLCEDPDGAHGGEPVEATEVDHIQNRRARPDLAFVESNVQVLCKSCHSRKTMREETPHG